MVKKVLIIGSGSISSKHKYAINSLSKKISIISISSRNFTEYYLKDRKIDCDYILICSPTINHFKHFKIIEKNFKNKRVLIEKPLFNKFYKIKNNLKNRYYVGYNLRFHPVLIYLKQFLTRKKIFSINVVSHSFLPNWRKINYRNSVSANKKLGGGVLLELSHELDYLKWIFKNIKIINVFNKKISNLKIDVDDILNITGRINKKIFLNLNKNFFSKLNYRFIKIDGNNFSLKADLINNTIDLFNEGKRKTIKFKNFKLIDTYKRQHFEIINEKLSNVCSIKESLGLMKLIQKIRNHD